MSKKKKQTKETTAHPLQVNKDFVFLTDLVQAAMKNLKAI